MKFASLILDKSVPEWKFHNIDYTKLKTAIKKVTTVNEPNDTNALQNLRNLFIEQIQNVNLFTSLKIKELSNRIISLESSILGFKQSTNMSPISQKRTLKLITLHLNDCNSELQKLSRFIIVQRIALRKLFKKFVKHSHLDQIEAKRYIETIENSSEFKDGYAGISIITINLDSYLLETSLIADVLQDIKVQKRNSRRNERELKANKKSNNNTKSDYVTSLEFDTIFLGKSIKVQDFLISFENIEEFKFLALKNGFNLVDDSVSETSKAVLRGTESLNTSSSSRSVKSFQDLNNSIKNGSSQPLNPLTTVAGTSPTNNLPLSPTLRASQPFIISRKNSRSSSFTTEGQTIRSQMEYILLSSKKNEYNFQFEDTCNQFPNVLLRTDYDNREDSNILLCYVGGIRNHIITSNIPRDCLSLLKDKDKQKLLNDKEISDQKRLDRVDSLSKTVINWAISHNLVLREPGFSFRRTRFIKYERNCTYYISVDQDFNINNEKIEHAFIEIRKNSIRNDKCNVNETNILKPNDSTGLHGDHLVSVMSKKMLENRLQAFPIENDESIWNILLHLQKSHKTQDELYRFLLKYIFKDDQNNCLKSEEFFELGRQLISEMIENDNDSDKNDILRVSNETSLSNLKSQPTKASRQESERYWNEFDDGEDFRENGFYIDLENSLDSNDNRPPNDHGFIKFSRSFIINMYFFCQYVRDKLGMDDNPSSQPLLDNNRRDNSYTRNNSLMNSTISTSASQKDLNRLYEYNQKDIEESESVYEYRHDQVITMIYLTTLAISAITSGITLGIVLALFTGRAEDSDLEVADFLIFIIIGSLLISLLLNCSSILILFSRYEFAPMWHYIMSFSMFILVTCTVCYGIVEIIV